MSEIRRKLIEWLSKIEISGSVIDVGGISWPMRFQVVDKGITDYKILDKREERKGINTDYVYDINKKFPHIGFYDNAFCTEVMQFIYDPFTVLNNIRYILKDNGKLFITFHLTHPPMKDSDYLRYTEKGIRKLLKETGFEIEELIEPIKGYYLVKAICQN